MPPAPPITPTLDEDVFCCRCTYNLRTLSKNSVCPECATPISWSLAKHQELVGLNLHLISPRRIMWGAIFLAAWSAMSLFADWVLDIARSGDLNSLASMASLHAARVLPALTFITGVILLATGTAPAFSRHRLWPRYSAVFLAALYAAIPVFDFGLDLLIASIPGLAGSGANIWINSSDNVRWNLVEYFLQSSIIMLLLFAAFFLLLRLSRQFRRPRLALTTWSLLAPSSLIATAAAAINTLTLLYIFGLSELEPLINLIALLLPIAKYIFLGMHVLLAIHWVIVAPIGYHLTLPPNRTRGVSKVEQA